MFKTSICFETLHLKVNVKYIAVLNVYVIYFAALKVYIKLLLFYIKIDVKFYINKIF